MANGFLDKIVEELERFDQNQLEQVYQIVHQQVGKINEKVNQRKKSWQRTVDPLELNTSEPITETLRQMRYEAT